MHALAAENYHKYKSDILKTQVLEALYLTNKLYQALDHDEITVNDM